MIVLMMKYMKCWEETLGMLRSPSVLAPFILLGALQFLLLSGLVLFSVPPLASVMVPVVELLGGERALHYPNHMMLLPRMYHLLYIPLVAVVGFALFGWAVSLMTDYYGRFGVKIPKYNRRPVMVMLPSVVFVGILFVLSISAVQLLFAYAGGLVPVALVGRLVSMAGVVVQIFVQALLIYSVYFVVTKTSNPFEAIARGVKFGKKQFLVTSMAVATVFLLHLPIDFITQHADKVALKFDPMLVYALLSAGIVFEIATNFFLFASTTSVATGGRREGIK